MVNRTRTKRAAFRGAMCGSGSDARLPSAISAKSFISKVMKPPRGMCDLCSLFRPLWITQKYRSDLNILSASNTQIFFNYSPCFILGTRKHKLFKGGSFNDLHCRSSVSIGLPLTLYVHMWCFKPWNTIQQWYPPIMPAFERKHKHGCTLYIYSFPITQLWKNHGWKSNQFYDTGGLQGFTSRDG